MWKYMLTGTHRLAACLFSMSYGCLSAMKMSFFHGFCNLEAEARFCGFLVNRCWDAPCVEDILEDTSHRCYNVCVEKTGRANTPLEPPASQLPLQISFAPRRDDWTAASCLLALPNLVTAEWSSLVSFLSVAVVIAAMAACTSGGRLSEAFFKVASSAIIVGSCCDWLRSHHRRLDSRDWRTLPGRLGKNASAVGRLCNIWRSRRP